MMTKDEYIDHEIRIRMMERLYEEMNKKLNALIGITITAVLIPLALKMWGI